MYTLRQITQLFIAFNNKYGMFNGKDLLINEQHMIERKLSELYDVVEKRRFDNFERLMQTVDRIDKATTEHPERFLPIFNEAIKIYGEDTILL